MALGLLLPASLLLAATGVAAQKVLSVMLLRVLLPALPPLPLTASPRPSCVLLRLLLLLTHTPLCTRLPSRGAPAAGLVLRMLPGPLCASRVRDGDRVLRRLPLLPLLVAGSISVAASSIGQRRPNAMWKAAGALAGEGGLLLPPRGLLHADLPTSSAASCPAACRCWPAARTLPAGDAALLLMPTSGLRLHCPDGRL
jgi:hypothetical protein